MEMTALVIIFALFAQTRPAPEQIPWKQVNFSPCGSPAGGTRLSLAQIGGECGLLTRAAAARAVINTHCIRCHGADLTHGDVSRVGGLDLRSRPAMLQGGGRGRVLIPGSLRSLIYWFVTLRPPEQNSADPGEVPLSMPPFFPLEQSTIDAIGAWILDGAPEP